MQIDGKLYDKGERAATPRTEIVPDFDKPYRSMITGEWIHSRAQHREHLRRHGYQEVGNDKRLYEKPKPISAASQRRKELLIAQVQAMTHEQWKAAGKRDLERLRWNTRGIPDPLKEI